jgi:signal transduction histidine kinase
VSDQGQGFDAATLLRGTPGSHGLLNIRQRLQLVGGRLDISSEPHAGTRVTIDAPRQRPVRA